jgi:general secretion pathway protein G
MKTEPKTMSQRAPIARRLAALRARARRGVTLIEILIVLAIIGLIAGGVAIVAVPKFEKARVDSTKTNAIEIHRAAELWRANHTSEGCPTAERLKTDKEISPTSKITDAWETPYKISCDEDSIHVVSLGPDKKEGTNDDIRVPDEGKK